MSRVRIVGGDWRGKALEVPEGRGTRPTTDRTREQVASMVLSSFGLDLAGVRVLDAFAGSGALGLEMLSRGAETCTLVEMDRRCAGLVRRNCAALGAGAAARVVCGDAFALAEAGRLPGGPFGLVLLDPPYAVEAERVSALVAVLAAAGMLAPGARVLYERAGGAAGLDVPGLVVVKSKDRGATGVDLLVWEGASRETAATVESGED